MITQPTVFVLGAGVSRPFGFPLGGELLHVLTGNIGQTNSPREKEMKDVHMRLVEFLNTHLMPGCMTAFIQELRRSMPSSIDTWLEYHPSYREVAKYAIAATIYEYESRCLKHEHVSDDWFSWIFSRLLKKVATPEEFLENKVTFITFNYDRLLEWKLLNALNGTFGEKFRSTIQEASRKFCRRIFHIHGSLTYDWTAGSSVEEVFGAIRLSGPIEGAGLSLNSSFDTCVRHLRYAHEGIRIIGEERQTSVDEKIVDAMKEAHQIVFLGFSYDERNLEALQINLWKDKKDIQVSNTRTRLPILGSAYGLRAAARQTVADYFGGRIVLGQPGLTCVPFCEEDVFDLS